MSEDADALFVFIPDTDGGPGREPALLFETPGEMKMLMPGSPEPIDPPHLHLPRPGFWSAGR